MAIEVGDRIPDVSLLLAGEDGPEAIETSAFFAGRRVVLFAIPGAFTPTCTARHLPGYLEELDNIRAKGVDAVACTAVNDPFVLAAWSDTQQAEGRIAMLADGSGEFVRAVGLEIDLSARGFGTRSRRYAMIVDDGVVRHLAVEEGAGVGPSGAGAILEALG